MLRSATLALLLAAGDTPEKTFDEVKKAVTERNWGALYDVLAPSERKNLEEKWEEAKKSKDSREVATTLQMLGIKEEEVRKLTGRELMLRLMPKMIEADPGGFERDFGKYKNGTLARTQDEGDACLLTIKVGDKEEEVELVREGGKWYLVTASHRKSNERNASASLKSCVTAQADFRANDRDGDGVNNFWVKDVAGLFGLQVAGETIRLIELGIAQADRTAGKEKYPSIKEEKPKAGYYYVSLKRYREEGNAAPYDDGKGKHFNRFGMAAYPAQYPQSGRLTFLTSEQNVMFSKDTRGKAPEEFPEDPEKDGWKRLD